MPAEVTKLVQEIEAIKERIRALEISAGFELPPKEKVRTPGHNYTQDQE